MAGSFNKKRKRTTNVPFIEREQIYLIQKPETNERKRLPDLNDRAFRVGAIVVGALIVALVVVAVFILL